MSKGNQIALAVLCALAGGLIALICLAADGSLLRGLLQSEMLTNREGPVYAVVAPVYLGLGMGSGLLAWQRWGRS